MDTSALAGSFQQRWQLERGIAEEAEEPAAFAPRESPAYLAALRVSRRKGKNVRLEGAAHHILRRTYLQQYRLGYPWSTPGTG